jgi:hypothetical protein
MEKFLGTVLLFEDLITGEQKKIWTNNGMAWMTLIEVPKMEEVDGEFIETDELVEAEQVIPYETLIQKYSPVEPHGKEFVKWCLGQVADGFTIKIGKITKYCEGIK